LAEPSGDDLFQTQTTIRRLLAQAGVSPRRRYGQHFLVDRNLMGKLVESAELDRGDVVLEVGPGTGSLTRLLAARVAEVIAVEIDPVLARVAAAEVGGTGRVSLLQMDALAGKSALAAPLLERLLAARPTGGGSLKLVANLPYDIATPLVINLLLSGLPIRRCCFTVQAEVAGRFLAPPSTRDFGPVSVVTQVLSTARRTCRVPARAFWPAPKVASAMLRLDLLSPSPLPAADRGPFAAFVRLFFLHRRRTLGHLVRESADPQRLDAALRAMDIDPRDRPEDVSPSGWLGLYLHSR
jgi:16S rRNA (adenine1518-N6/adenine1519-N6)-dimethyltransferase